MMKRKIEESCSVGAGTIKTGPGLVKKGMLHVKTKRKKQKGTAKKNIDHYEEQDVQIANKYEIRMMVREIAEKIIEYSASGLLAATPDPKPIKRKIPYAANPISKRKAKKDAEMSVKDKPKIVPKKTENEYDDEAQSRKFAVQGNKERLF